MNKELISRHAPLTDITNKQNIEVFLKGSIRCILDPSDTSCEETNTNIKENTKVVKNKIYNRNVKKISKTDDVKIKSIKTFKYNKNVNVNKFMNKEPSTQKLPYVKQKFVILTDSESSEEETIVKVNPVKSISNLEEIHKGSEFIIETNTKKDSVENGLLKKKQTNNLPPIKSKENLGQNSQDIVVSKEAPRSIRKNENIKTRSLIKETNTVKTKNSTNLKSENKRQKLINDLLENNSESEESISVKKNLAKIKKSGDSMKKVKGGKQMKNLNKKSLNKSEIVNKNKDMHLTKPKNKKFTLNNFINEKQPTKIKNVDNKSAKLKKKITSKKEMLKLTPAIKKTKKPVKNLQNLFTSTPLSNITIKNNSNTTELLSPITCVKYRK